MINKERILNHLFEYVKIDSETLNEKAFADHMVGILKNLGFEIKRDHAGEKIGSNTSNIIAKRKGEKSGPILALSAHLDTVMPGNGIEPMIVENHVRSKGDTILGADDKAGIAAIIEGIQTALEKNIPLGDLEVILTIAEEGGLNGAKNLDYDLVESQFAYVFDSGGIPGEIMVKGPAQDKIEIIIKGRSAHAGICPEEGINAIQVAAKAIDQMKLLRIDEETTANIGIIKGGNATNIVCSEVTIQAEARSLDNDKLDLQTKHMVQCFKEACEAFDADYILNIERAYSAYLIEGTDPFLEYTRKRIKAMDLVPVETASGGGSDTNVYNANGIKAINLGIGMRKCHTLDEYIAIEHLEQTAELVLSIISEFWNSDLYKLN